MAKFILYESGSLIPDSEFQGDYMIQKGTLVTIFKRSTNPAVKDEHVAAIRLKQNQHVRKD